MPYALSCRVAYRAHAQTFDARWRKLQRLLPKLSAAAIKEGGRLRAVPEQPQCCQVHLHIGPGDADQLDAARGAVEEEHGVRVYGRLIGPSGRVQATRDDVAHNEDDDCCEQEHFFELSLGPSHVDEDDGVFVNAWTAYFRALRQIREAEGGAVAQ
jgi:hypothetical protein